MSTGIAFLQVLAEHSLPMPQNEGQFHAARVFSDLVSGLRLSLDLDALAQASSFLQEFQAVFISMVSELR